jgi:hypothetical protein
MKRNINPWDSEDLLSLCVLIVVGLAIVGGPAFAIYKFHMESATFNRLTGANTTWWDAAWVELRIQEVPKP